ncbi:MAG: ethanolamine ammonia-lyase subunit EutC [Bradyrhizobium sp.]|uniref:ethanolamine ammonia-lyase subunit EutC n=1 Tax=Bradyrhizobium sp. TaxID=376 RepID=UPI0011F9C8A9|nr:ethanolamine ammonia-lyase subunit EutC [Bradyrhizobium sp.]THD75549.1 MAG: ethanolamine ammonia-lyase subunit EutC [Bradyrhizobium sp.]
MKPPSVPSRSLRDLRELTPARVGLGRAGASMPTEALLEFTLDHARARDAVHAAFDVQAITAGLGDLGLEAFAVASRARNRKDYLRRPDLGRMLDEASRHLLTSRRCGSCRLAIVVGDGLSPSAVNAHAVGLVRSLIPRLADDGIEIGHAVVASGARVALGDEIGAILGARMIVMLIGERPGLSAPDSLGAYLTFAPRVGLTDAERNCVSNIHGAGLGYDEAGLRIAWLVREGLAREITGVALKDESGGRTPQRITVSSSHSGKPAT